MPRVLLVDDDPEAIEWLSELIRSEGYTVAAVDSLKAARIHLTRSTPELILTDLMLPDGQGIELLADFGSRPAPAIVVVTGYASIESAIEAMRAGATDYLIKPLDHERLRGILSRMPKTEVLREEIGELRSELIRLGHFGHMLGNSPAMRRIYNQIDRVAPTSATVLLIGESGTGKEVVAQTLHDLSRRKRQPFLPLNCGAVSPQLIESELFGHEKGSFTGALAQRRGWFERANGGSLFLDEVGELPAAAQVRLLRVLQDGVVQRVGGEQELRVSVRVIAATHRDLPAMIRTGAFREDLWYRIATFPVVLPPLRDRLEDIPALAEHWAQKAANRFGLKAVRPGPTDLRLLEAYSWPGNVREFAAVMDRAVILGGGERLEIAKALGFGVIGTAPVVALPNTAAEPAGTSVCTLDEAMRRHIERALAHAHGRIDGPHGVAKLLAINPHTLRARMKKLGIDWSRFKPL